MISYGKQTIEKDDIEALLEAVKSDWLTQGPTVELFEHKLSKYFGSKYSCAVSNGTAALHLSAVALGWSKGDVVFTTTNSFLATANCIVYTGATPYFIDIDPQNFNINIDKLETAIKSQRLKNKSIKAIIGVDYAGHPCDWKSLRYLADKYNLKLINDNCHAMGASLNNDKTYAIKYADIVTQSYHPVKHITTGEGGSVMTNDTIINEKVKSLRSHGIIRKDDWQNRKNGPWYYEMKAWDTIID